MDKIIEEYLNESEGFSKMFGKDGILKIEQSAIHPRLLDVTVRWQRENGIPFDARDLKELGIKLILLSEKLKDKEDE